MAICKNTSKATRVFPSGMALAPGETHDDVPAGDLKHPVVKGWVDGGLIEIAKNGSGSSKARDLKPPVEFKPLEDAVKQAATALENADKAVKEADAGLPEAERAALDKAAEAALEAFESAETALADAKAKAGL